MLKGAIIGVGNIAIKGHLPAYLSDEALRSKATLVAFADLSPANLAMAKVLVPSARLYTSAPELLKSEDVDFVDICSPPDSRRQIIEQVLAHGCHIVCEKPLATNTEEGRTIVDLVREKSIVFVPCHQYRYSKVWKSVKEIIDRGELGKVVLAQFNIFRTKADSGTPEWQSEWRIDPEISGGGIMVDTGSHYFYLLSYLFGKPKRFTARTANLRHHDYPVEDTALILAEYENSMVQINLTWAADRRENKNSIIGTKGSLFTNGDRILLYLNGVEKEIPGEDVSDKATYVRWYAELFKEFLSRVECGNHSMNLLEEAMDVLVWTESCFESAMKGVTVSVQ